MNDRESLATLHAALDGGVNFFDTADVYGDGRSERLLAKLKKERGEKFHIATKAGRRLPAQTPDAYHRKNLTKWVDRSLRNLKTDAIDLLQLHCPHPEVYYRPEVFGILDDLVTEGEIRHYGVSVEKVEEALKAIEFPNVKSVQIIFNIFRQRPAERLFAEAQRRKVGILARVPLASGLLSGKITRDDEEDCRALRQTDQTAGPSLLVTARSPLHRPCMTLKPLWAAMPCEEPGCLPHSSLTIWQLPHGCPTTTSR